MASGWSVSDDLVEAIELPGEHPFALGVLWHPEEDERAGARARAGVIASLVEAARAAVGTLSGSRWSSPPPSR